MASGPADTIASHPALARLAQDDPSVREYTGLRLAGFNVVTRHISFDGHLFRTRLHCQRGLITTSVESSTAPFHQCCLSHLFTSRFLLLPEEVGQQAAQVLSDSDAFNRLSVRVRSGVLQLTGAQVRGLEIIETSGKESVRSYKFQVLASDAGALTQAPPDPSIEVRLLVDGVTVADVSGYVDRIIPFQRDGDWWLEVSGGDVLTGSRSQVGARFNFRVDPTFSIFILATWLDPIALGARPTSNYDSVTVTTPTGYAHAQVSDAIDAVAKLASNVSIKDLCRAYCKFLKDNPKANASQLAQAFRNMATLLESDLKPYVAIGAVRGMRVEGLVGIGPNVILGGADQLPFGLIGQPTNVRLCDHWPSDSVHLITFFCAGSAQETPDAGWGAIELAFDLIQTVVLDTAWCHTDPSGSIAQRFVADGRQQDSILELDRWFHVHHLYDGIAHQYLRGATKSTNRLEVDELAIQALQPRLQLLGESLDRWSATFPRMCSHLKHAIRWISRSRSSSSTEERFICLWIAAEYLCLRSDPASSRDDDIKGTVCSRLAAIMGRRDKSTRKLFQRKMEECYDLRNGLVHNALEGHPQAEALSQALAAATIEVVFTCSIGLPKLASDMSPAEVLDQLRRKPPV